MERKNHIRSLVEKACEGDRQAFDRLTKENYERSRSLVLHFLGGIPRGISVDDVLQETFFRAYLQIKKFKWEGEDSFFRWLGGIARNVILEFHKKRERSPLIGLRGDQPGSRLTQSRVLRREERFSRFEKSLDALSPEHREVIQLASFEGLPLPEVARRMNRSHGAVRQLLWRALQELKSSFGDTESLHLPDKRIESKGSENDG